MGGPKFDVTTDKGMAAFNGFMGSKSYVEGWSMSDADLDVYQKMTAVPDRNKMPHAYRWYIHIAALQGMRGLHLMTPTAAGAAFGGAGSAAPAPATVKKAKADDDDFDDMFGDEEEDDDDTPKFKKPDDNEVVGDDGETYKQRMERLKKEAEERTAKKEAKQRTLVAIEVKPWDVEQDLMALWKKITTTIQQDGLKWGENCTLADVAFGIKKIQTTFVMGVNNSSDDVIEAIEAMEDEVQSAEVTSMNVL